MKKLPSQVPETSIDKQEDWSPRFLEELKAAANDRESHKLVDQMREAIAANRRSREWMP